LLLVCLPTFASFTPNSAEADVQALVSFGSRVPGTPASEQARTYLIAEYRQAGYVTELGTFTYPKFQDLGSALSVGGVRLEGRALKGSAGQVTASLVVVPGVGRPNDFAAVDVAGAIAIVRRGEIPFLEKARNATGAGAVGLVIVNTDSNEFSGMLQGEVNIPVLGLSGKQGEPLLETAKTQPLRASLNVNARAAESTPWQSLRLGTKISRCERQCLWYSGRSRTRSSPCEHATNSSSLVCCLRR